MAFGKRLGPAVIDATPSSSPALRDHDAGSPTPFIATPVQDLATTSAVSLERSTALRDDILRLHGQAASLAGLIQSRTPLDGRLLDAATAPTSYPLLVEDFQRHFSHLDGGRLFHSIYSLSPAFDPGRKMPLLQLKLIQLMGVVLDLNRRCLSAHKDGALSIAVQSKESADEVDQIIVDSAVAAALLECLVLDQSRAPVEEGSPEADLDTHRETLVGAIARARSRMLEPDTFERRIPKLNWPVLVSEQLIEPHAGQRMINDVYASASLVALLEAGPALEAPSLFAPATTRPG